MEGFDSYRRNIEIKFAMFTQKRLSRDAPCCKGVHPKPVIFCRLLYNFLLHSRRRRQSNVPVRKIERLPIEEHEGASEEQQYQHKHARERHQGGIRLRSRPAGHKLDQHCALLSEMKSNWHYPKGEMITEFLQNLRRPKGATHPAQNSKQPQTQMALSKR